MFLMLSAFGAAALAAGMALIPIVVHLLHRQKVTPIAWGAMQFLLETPLKVRRRRRIDNWLLMLVRILILALLALLLARPVAQLSEVRASAPTDVVVILDHSMTMGARGGGAGTLFEKGIDIAERTARMLPDSGTVSIILAESAPRIITPTPVKMGPSQVSADGTPQGEWARHLNTLRQLKPSMSRGDIPKAVAAARDLLVHGYNTRKVILIVSDNQRTNWEPNAEQLWRQAAAKAAGVGIEIAGNEIPIFNVPVTAAGSSLPNVSVRAVTVMPAFLGTNRPAQIFATVANTGSSDLVSVPLQMEVDGKAVNLRQIPTLAAGESVTVRFDYYFPEAGSHWVRVKSDLVDALEADNAATAAVSIHPKLPVLVVDGQLTQGSGGRAGNFPQAAFLLAAMQPVDPSIDAVTLIDPKVVSVAEFSAPQGIAYQDYPIVVLNDVPRLSKEAVDDLTAYARRGNGVLMILGPRAEEAFINDVLAKSALAPISTRGIMRAAKSDPSQPAAAAYASVTIKEVVNPAVALMTQGERSGLGEVTMRSWWQVTPIAGELRTVLATTSESGSGGGSPLILEMEQGKVGGRVVVWASGVSSLEWNNLPLIPNFVPLVNETLFHLASGQDVGQPRQIDVGKSLVWTGPSNVPVETATLIQPDGSSRTLQAELRGDHYLVENADTRLPGLYEMRFTAPPKQGATPPPTVFFSVNLDREELDPAILSSAELEWFKSHGFLQGVLSAETLAKALDAGNSTYEYWWAISLVVLCLVVFEVFLTYLHVRKQSGMSLEEAGLAGAMPASVTARAEGA